MRTKKMEPRFLKFTFYRKLKSFRTGLLKNVYIYTNYITDYFYEY
jgi:hypothetical protein